MFIIKDKLNEWPVHLINNHRTGQRYKTLLTRRKY